MRSRWYWKCLPPWAKTANAPPLRTAGSLLAILANSASSAPGDDRSAFGEQLELGEYFVCERGIPFRETSSSSRGGERPGRIAAVLPQCASEGQMERGIVGRKHGCAREREDGAGRIFGEEQRPQPGVSPGVVREPDRGAQVLDGLVGPVRALGDARKPQAGQGRKPRILRRVART